MTLLQRTSKRAFDVVASFSGLVLLGWLILLCWLIATIDTGKNGFFKQIRIGKHGKPFYVVKIRTMREAQGYVTTVTTNKDPRISSIGKIFRRTKLDELPQLWNVFKGKMSFVGPRPDVPGFADLLDGEDEIILTVRPGITGPASLKYKDEEKILALQDNPETYNREIIWPEKVAINKDYIVNYRFWIDIKYIFSTIFGRPLIKK